MDLRLINENQKSQYNKLVTHVIQSWEWGEARKNLGTPLIRYGIYRDGHLVKAFQLTLHKIPLTKKYIGYLPKGPFPDKDLVEALIKICKDQKCVFIKIESQFPFNVSTIPYNKAKDAKIQKRMGMGTVSD